MEFEGLVIYVT
jgi:hypothetical protein